MQRQQWVFYPIRLNVFPFVGTNWKQSFVHQTFFPKGAAWKQTERLVAWPLLADIHKTILSPWPIFFLENKKLPQRWVRKDWQHRKETSGWHPDDIQFLTTISTAGPESNKIWGRPGGAGLGGGLPACLRGDPPLPKKRKKERKNKPGSCGIQQRFQWRFVKSGLRLPTKVILV